MKQESVLNSASPSCDSINWWHQIDLGNGVITPGRDKTFAKIKRIRMPADLSWKYPCERPADELVQWCDWA